MASFTYHDRFNGDYLVKNTERRPDPVDVRGTLPCFCDPFHGIPLRLRLRILPDGTLAFFAWEWHRNPDANNPYLHTDVCTQGSFDYDAKFVPTSAQRETVEGLFSGRVKWEGLRLNPGRTLQRAVQGIDIQAEENRIGRQIYLA